ncbi:hypothetical protein IMG5_101470 [Ichthyophthirius multifiliis]|uniref:Uncharacterized protein n=1 Tax=Ichthyophthirius multifiliis TaxID=5932 RepID=G0QSJ5_ICHMU|nr:hypothetical protein IMG5_101470 [Ichthyophthirius multifiliis]EGR31833.1 hypothetical protein IMG5_101470 [Ichthyophthirius multifiliis]|eukprot:XP_004035319.1 hypothetical protein IMG5_101470 [Ichthyophthirius multifiliis]
MNQTQNKSSLLLNSTIRKESFQLKQQSNLLKQSKLLNQEYFMNVYGGLVKDVRSVQQLKNIRQRNKQFNNISYTYGCPCFHLAGPQQKRQRILKDDSWYTGDSSKIPIERPMIISFLQAIPSSFYGDLMLSEEMLSGQWSSIKRTKKNEIDLKMKRSKFYQILNDPYFEDQSIKITLEGKRKKEQPIQVSISSFYNIHSGTIMQDSVGNYSRIFGNQCEGKIDKKQMSQFVVQLVEKESEFNVQDVVSYNYNQQVNNKGKEFIKNSKCKYNIVLVQKQRPSQISKEAIEVLEELGVKNQEVLKKMFLQYDDVYAESLTSLAIIIRDLALLDFIYQQTANKFQNDIEFRKFISVETFRGYQQIAHLFQKERKFFICFVNKINKYFNRMNFVSLCAQPSEDYSNNIKNSQILTRSFDQKKTSFDNFIGKCINNIYIYQYIYIQQYIYIYIYIYINIYFIYIYIQFSLQFLNVLKNEPDGLNTVIQNQIKQYHLNNYAKQFKYFDKFEIPAEFENNQFQCIVFGNSDISKGRKSKKLNRNDIRYFNLIHNAILNQKNLNMFIERYKQCKFMFLQKDISGNTPGLLLFKKGNTQQILNFMKNCNKNIIKSFQNDTNQNILHFLFQNKIADIDQILEKLPKQTINELKNQESKQGIFPLQYYLKLKQAIKFQYLTLIVPEFPLQNTEEFIKRSFFLSLFNLSLKNKQVLLFLIDRVNQMNCLYKYSYVYAKLIEYKLSSLYNSMMIQLIEDENCLCNILSQLDFKISHRFMNYFSSIDYEIGGSDNNQDKIREILNLQKCNQKVLLVYILYNNALNNFLYFLQFLCYQEFQDQQQQEYLDKKIINIANLKNFIQKSQKLDEILKIIKKDVNRLKITYSKQMIQALFDLEIFSFQEVLTLYNLQGKKNNKNPIFFPFQNMEPDQINQQKITFFPLKLFTQKYKWAKFYLEKINSLSLQEDQEAQLFLKNNFDLYFGNNWPDLWRILCKIKVQKKIRHGFYLFKYLDQLKMEAVKKQFPNKKGQKITVEQICQAVQEYQYGQYRELIQNWINFSIEMPELVSSSLYLNIFTGECFNLQEIEWGKKIIQLCQKQELFKINFLCQQKLKEKNYQDLIISAWKNQGKMNERWVDDQNISIQKCLDQEQFQDAIQKIYFLEKQEQIQIANNIFERFVRILIGLQSQQQNIIQRKNGNVLNDKTYEDLKSEKEIKKRKEYEQKMESLLLLNKKKQNIYQYKKYKQQQVLFMKQKITTNIFLIEQFVDNLFDLLKENVQEKNLKLILCFKVEKVINFLIENEF